MTLSLRDPSMKASSIEEMMTAAAVERIGGGEEKVSREQEDDDLIHELLHVVESVRSFSDFRRTQRKACFNLIRWMKLLVPLLEEIQEAGAPISDDAYLRLRLLAKSFAAAKKLLRFCHDGSKIYLTLESEAMTARFRAIYEKWNQALEGMPYDDLGVSAEVKEQVELVNLQLKRSKRRTDTQDMELAMDLMVILENKDDRNADGAILERLGKKLELQTVADLRAETMAIKKLANERNGQSAGSTQQIIELMKKFKLICGVEAGDALSDISLPKYLEKCPSLMIPSDFLCPISLEIMTDPVIVATGQTYERRSIQKWLDAGQRTCPKTRQTLAHLSLAPNYALKNLILQWCEKNKVELQKRDTDPDSKPADHRGEISSLVNDLSSIHLDVQRRAVKKIRVLSKENSDNRILIAENGGIPALISLLHYPDSRIQENTVTALLNLSIDEGNKKLITKEGAIPAIIDTLKTGTVEAKENSAAALFSLSMLDENKIAIGNLNGIPPLVDLLQNGTIRGKKDAATALFNLVLDQRNRARAIEADIIAALLKVLDDKNLGMVDEVLSIILLLASNPDGRSAIGKSSFIETIVGLVKEGTPKNKECALAVLLELGSNCPSFVQAALNLGIFDHLSEVATSGTTRAQRKANSLMQLIRKYEQIP